MIEKRLLSCIDWPLLFALVLLCSIGLVTIYSATYDPANENMSSEFVRHLLVLGIGLLALTGALLIDYRSLVDRALVFYGAVLILLVITLLIGSTGGGARRWITLGPVNFQPSEFSRLAVAIALTLFYARLVPGQIRVGGWLIGGIFVGVPFILIFQEPDLGAAVTLLPVGLTIMVFAGLRLRVLAVMVFALVLVTPVVWEYGLQKYQKDRVLSFLDPEKDPLGTGYQQIQAQVTVGSGGVLGRGFLQGTQSRYDFLPVAHNDFIFSVLAEERGFLGVLFTLALYLFVIVRSLDTATLAGDRTGVYLAVGLIAGFAFQVIYSVTMSAGFAPVKGLTLPLLSYGGSSTIATLLSFGLILNVRMRRFTN